MSDSSESSSDGLEEPAFPIRMRESCAHERALGNQFKDNLVGMVIAMKGGPCTGKTTLARALAKSFRCTLASYDDFLYSSGAETFLSSCPSIDNLPTNHVNDLPYEMLWLVARTQLGRHHNVIIDSPLHTAAQLGRLRDLGSSERRATIMPVIIECQALDKAEWRRRLSKKACSPEKVERILQEEDDYDTGDTPKLTIDTTSQLGIEQHVTNLEKFIMSCLDKKLYGVMPITGLAAGCTDCKMAYVKKLTAHLPRTLKHQCHEHELALSNCARICAFGKSLSYHCYGCGGRGRNLHYSCTDYSCRFYLHAKCALNLPPTVTPSFHWHPLVLTSRPLPNSGGCFCDYYLCEKERDPEDWFYFCEECEHHVHVRCANPEFYNLPDLVGY